MATIEQIEQNKRDIENKYSGSIRGGVFVGSKEEELKRTIETEQMIRRMGGRTEQIEALRRAKEYAAKEAREREYKQYQHETVEFSKQVEEYNKQASTYNLQIDEVNRLLVGGGAVQTVTLRPKSRPHPRNPETEIIGFDAFIDIPTSSTSSYFDYETQVKKGTKTKEEVTRENIGSVKGYWGLGSEDIIKIDGSVFQSSLLSPDNIGLVNKAYSQKQESYKQYERERLLEQDRLKTEWLVTGRGSWSQPAAFTEAYKARMGGAPSNALIDMPKYNISESQLQSQKSLLGSTSAVWSDTKAYETEAYKMQSRMGTITPAGDQQFKFSPLSEISILSPAPQQPKTSFEERFIVGGGTKDQVIFSKAAIANRYAEQLEEKRTKEAESMKKTYTKDWWGSLKPHEKAIVGGHTIFQNLFSGSADALLTKEGFADFPALAYQTKKTQAHEGFLKNLVKSESLQVGGTALVFGAGLGLVSKVAPRLATGAGITAGAVAVGDIGYSAYTGDKRATLIKSSMLIAAAPFAGAGFKAVGGRTAKILPDIKMPTIKAPSGYSVPGLLVRPDPWAKIPTMRKSIEAKGGKITKGYKDWGAEFISRERKADIIDMSSGKHVSAGRLVLKQIQQNIQKVRTIPSSKSSKWTSLAEQFPEINKQFAGKLMTQTQRDIVIANIMKTGGLQRTAHVKKGPLLLPISLQKQKQKQTSKTVLSRVSVGSFKLKSVNKLLSKTELISVQKSKTKEKLLTPQTIKQIQNVSFGQIAGLKMKQPQILKAMLKNEPINIPKRPSVSRVPRRPNVLPKPQIIIKPPKMPQINFPSVSGKSQKSLKSPRMFKGWKVRNPFLTFKNL